MEFSRRKFIYYGAGSFFGFGMGITAASANNALELINTLIDGKQLGDGGISLIAPEIAENGNNVPIEFSAEGAKTVTIFADGNPEAVMAKFNFGKLNPTRSAKTRVRLSQTQNVYVIAEMEDGSIQQAQANVKVTIGGCGG